MLLACCSHAAPRTAPRVHSWAAAGKPAGHSSMAPHAGPDWPTALPGAIPASTTAAHSNITHRSECCCSHTASPAVGARLGWPRRRAAGLRHREARLGSAQHVRGSVQRRELATQQWPQDEGAALGREAEQPRRQAAHSSRAAAGSGPTRQILAAHCQVVQVLECALGSPAGGKSACKKRRAEPSGPVSARKGWLHTRLQLGWLDRKHRCGGGGRSECAGGMQALAALQ